MTDRGREQEIRNDTAVNVAGLLKGATWEEIDAVGREMRRLWADFARGDGLEQTGGIPGALEYRTM